MTKTGDGSHEKKRQGGSNPSSNVQNIAKEAVKMLDQAAKFTAKSPESDQQSKSQLSALSLSNLPKLDIIPASEERSSSSVSQTAASKDETSIRQELTDPGELSTPPASPNTGLGMSAFEKLLKEKTPEERSAIESLGNELGQVSKAQLRQILALLLLQQDQIQNNSDVSILRSEVQTLRAELIAMGLRVAKLQSGAGHNMKDPLSIVKDAQVSQQQSQASFPCATQANLLSGAPTGVSPFTANLANIHSNIVAIASSPVTTPTEPVVTEHEDTMSMLSKLWGKKDK